MTHHVIGKIYTREKYMANTQYVARWDKSGKRKKSGRPPTFFTVPSPVQPPLGLIFDILIFSYQK